MQGGPLYRLCVPGGVGSGPDEQETCVSGDWSLMGSWMVGEQQPRDASGELPGWCQEGLVQSLGIFQWALGDRWAWAA